MWERWDKDGKSLASSTIVTTAAEVRPADIHDRQPAIIDSGLFDDLKKRTATSTA